MQPNIKEAVEELVYMIESQTALTGGKQNREVVAASRNALNALIGTRNVDVAKRWMQQQGA